MQQEANSIKWFQSRQDTGSNSKTSNSEDELRKASKSPGWRGVRRKEQGLFAVNPSPGKR